MTYVYLILTTFFWAATFHLGKYAIGYVSPLSAAAWRFILAGAVLAVYVQWHKGWDLRALRRNAWPMIAMGIIGVFGFNVALFLGLQHTSAVNCALIMAFNPAMTAVFSAVLNREVITSRQIAGFLVSLLGVMVIITRGSLHNLLTLSFSRGDLLILLGCACFAAYGVIPKRFVKQMPTMLLTTGTLIVGAVALTITATLTTHDLFVMPAPNAIAAVIAMALFGSVIAYLWWNRSIAQLGPARAANFINLVPTFTALIGAALGQAISAAQITGALLVIAGVLITTSQQRTPVMNTLIAQRRPSNCAAQ